MPLENLVGSKYISDLNADWPTDTDGRPDGDDHLRGIKNVLKQTFPALSGPVTLDQDTLNRGSIPSGSKLVFYNSTAPVGWTKQTVSNVMMLTVGDTYVASGGSMSPVLMNVVPAHSHVVSGNTGGQSANHTHSGSTNTAGQHTHSYTKVTALTQYHDNGSYQPGWTTVGDQTGAAGNHAHSLTTGGASVDHTHAVSIASQNNTGSANWTPRYTTGILCTKD